MSTEYELTVSKNSIKVDSRDWVWDTVIAWPATGRRCRTEHFRWKELIKTQQVILVWFLLLVFSQQSHFVAFRLEVIFRFDCCALDVAICVGPGFTEMSSARISSLCSNGIAIISDRYFVISWTLTRKFTSVSSGPNKIHFTDSWIICFRPWTTIEGRTRRIQTWKKKSSFKESSGSWSYSDWEGGLLCLPYFRYLKLLQNFMKHLRSFGLFLLFLVSLTLESSICELPW